MPLSGGSEVPILPDPGNERCKQKVSAVASQSWLLEGAPWLPTKPAGAVKVATIALGADMQLHPGHLSVVVLCHLLRGAALCFHLSTLVERSLTRTNYT